MLRGDTVLYASAPDLRKAIEYDLEQERQFDYSKVDQNGFVKHIAKFVSGLGKSIHSAREILGRLLYLRFSICVLWALT